MIAFAELLERLVFTPSRNAKIALLRRYFATQPDPDRGVGLAAITGELAFTAAKPRPDPRTRRHPHRPGLVRLVMRLCRRNLAETVALMLAGYPDQRRPAAPGRRRRSAGERPPSPTLSKLVAGWLDACTTPPPRFALLKLITGGLRVGVSARLAKIALAEIGGVDADAVEEVWHGLAPPYLPLFAWLEGRAEKPDPADQPVFRPPHAGASPGTEADIAALRPEDWRAEWKWDGIRVQLVATAGEAASCILAAPRISPPASLKSSKRWRFMLCLTASCW